MKIVSLSSVAKIIGGFAFKSNQFVEKGIPIIRISNISHGKVDLSLDPVYYPEVMFNQLEDYQLHNGDILIAMSGATTGKIGVVEVKGTSCLLNQRVGKFVITDNSLLPEYLRWVLISPYYQRSVWNYAVGCAQPNVSPKQLESIKIPFPETKVQRRIAFILEKVESAKQKRQESLRLTNEFIKSAFIEMFGDPCVNSKNLDSLPLAKVAVVTMGQSPPSSTYNENSEGLPFFQGKAEFGEIYPEASKWCSEPSRIAQKDDILMSVRAPVGPTNIAETKCCIGRGLCAITSKEINYLFLFYQLRLLEPLICGKGQGSTFGAIRRDDVENIKIIYPEQRKQQKFANLVQKVEVLKSKQRQSEQELGSLFNSLMQKAFKGELFN